MNNFLLFFIIVAQVVIIFQLKKILSLVDFSSEDAQLKATSERVKEATDKLPKPIGE